MKKNIPKENIISIFKTMLKINLFEKSIENLMKQNMIHGTTHLCIGEEAAYAGTILALDQEDYALGTHRSHGITIAKGSSLYQCFCEMLAREDGLCGGVGGSMHFADVKNGLLGTNGIVAANIPISCGVAKYIKLKKKSNVCISFFGDGTVNAGAFHEAINLALIWELPIVFCLVNNAYAISTTAQNSLSCSLYERCSSYTKNVIECNGNDALEIFENAKKARELASQNKPTFLILNTYRISGHSKSDKNLYRDEDEIQQWQKKSPILLLEKYLIDNQLTSSNELEEIKNSVIKDVEDSLAKALESKKTGLHQALRFVY